VWQRLVEEVGSDGFTVVAVALDSEPGAAQPWIEQAAPTYPCLIDREHRVAELYNLVNVPQAVWIDERGRIVRPPEVAGVYDTLNRIDAASQTIPQDVQANARASRLHYLSAIKDWVANGTASPYALSEEGVVARITRPDETVALAHANFRLGRYLMDAGRAEEARSFLDEARRLHPDSWAMWRQAADKLPNGIAAGPEFMARVRERALADKPYYAPVDMKGMPK
jgi:hypothetical protein